MCEYVCACVPVYVGGLRGCACMHENKYGLMCNDKLILRLNFAVWEGADCDIFSDNVIGNKCNNGTSCVDGHRKYTCICAQGFTDNVSRNICTRFKSL